MKIDIIATIGPASLNADTIKALENEGATIFRVNGSYGTLSHIRKYVRGIKRFRHSASILVDLPGMKVRTKNLEKPVRLRKGKTFTLRRDQVNHVQFFGNLKKGDVITADDSKLIFECARVNGNMAHFIAHIDGALMNNKGMHGHDISDFPFVYKYDAAIIDTVYEEDVDYLGVSFVRYREDVLNIKRRLAGWKRPPEMMVKIETRQAMDNLDAIIKEARTFLLDRGDLSAEINIVNLPQAQDMIIKKVKKTPGKRLFVATQFLHNMVRNRLPLIAEVNDIYSVLRKKVDGIQLSEEVSMGRFPVECVKLVRKIAEKL